MKKLEIKVPSLGESITEATVSKWYKKVGEYIEKDEVIAELETDKVTQEIYATYKGKVSKVFFEEGKDVKIGDTLVIIEASDDENDKRPDKKIDSTTKSSEEKIQLKIPSLGESITEVIIGKWLVKEGECVIEGDPLVEVETDKVTQELYAEKDIVLEKILISEEKEAKIGDTIAILKVNNINSENNTIPSKLLKENNIVQNDKPLIDLDDLDPTSIRRTGIGDKIKLTDLKEFVSNKSLSPAAKKYLGEKKLEIENIKNINDKSKLSKSDLIENISNDSNLESEHNNIDVVKPLSKLRQSIANRLKQAQNSAAMLTTFNEINMQAVMDVRKRNKEAFLNKHNVKLGFMSFFTKASISVLKEIPEINAEIKDNNIIYKNRYDIGIAVGTDKGLFVPILRDAENMSFAQIEKKIRNFGELAKENKITLDQMKDGTFTISNGGVYGSMLSTPILNSPQSGILGLHNIVKRPVVIENEIVIRPVMYVALTYDHRIIDGKQAVTFLVRLKEIIEKPETIMFDL
ncbi:MAG: dihydrolipoyllysine-residue succinyltransferase [Rickettsiales bacterium]|nr:dihydrolipoyllysine-residue succinyltransferase [Rickettsiales bacterium]